MSFAFVGHGPLDYRFVTYEGSRLRYRGPAPARDQPFVLCLGGSETFGKFIAQPYAQRLGALTGLEVANMGAMNAGLELILHDAAIADAMARADAIVLQVTGAHAMTNRFFAVHPRRNDRFLRASDILRIIYRDVDFAEFHFTRHLLGTLQSLSEDRFQIVADELKMAWMARMRTVLNRAICPVHLLWIGHAPPNEQGFCPDLGPDPLFVTRQMVEEIAKDAASLTICVTDEEEAARPARGKFFAASEENAARALPGPEAHGRAADQLAQAIAQLR